jgi:hypothetical protein
MKSPTAKNRECPSLIWATLNAITNPTPLIPVSTHHVTVSYALETQQRDLYQLKAICSTPASAVLEKLQGSRAESVTSVPVRCPCVVCELGGNIMEKSRAAR